MKKGKKIYLIRESDDGFESSKVIGSFDNFELANAAVDGLQTYSKFADNGKRYVIEYFDICNSVNDLEQPIGRPAFVYFGYTPDGDLYGDFSFMNEDPTWPHHMLVVDIPSNFKYKHENDVFVVIRVPVYINDEPENVKERGSEMANTAFNRLKKDGFDLNLLRTAGSEYLQSKAFMRLPEMEFNNNKVFMLGVL